jgi:NAD(P)-dependent dehydrogenase (short-subunit alcohol dehydrogenase family)
MQSLMDGKVLVITGGTSGIGQVAAEELAGMGARIVLVARDKARAEATRAGWRRPSEAQPSILSKSYKFCATLSARLIETRRIE